MNTFHQSGISQSKSRGSGYINSLIGASKNIKRVCTVFFKDRPKTVEQVLEKGNDIKGCTVSDVISEIDIRNVYPNDNSEAYGMVTDEDEVWKPRWYSLFEIMNEYKPWSKSTYCISLTLDIQHMISIGISVSDIASHICDTYEDATCVPSPVNIGILDIFFVESTITLRPEQEGVITERNKILCYFTEVVIPGIRKLHIAGVPDVSDVTPYNLKTGEWVIQTTNGTLLDIFDKNSVDVKRTISNDMWDIYNTLGIEAVRIFIINEFFDLISDNGDTVDPRHIKLLVDQMTFDGSIKAASRNGIGREVGPLAKASFEEPLDNFIKAAAMSEVDNITGVSAAVMEVLLVNSVLV